MKLTGNFYYSKNSEAIVRTTNHWSWQDGAPRGLQGSTALIVWFFSLSLTIGDEPQPSYNTPILHFPPKPEIL